MYKPGHWVSFQGLCTARTDFSLFSLAARPLGFRPHRLKAVDRLTDSQGCRGAHTALPWEEQVSRWRGAQAGAALAGTGTQGRRRPWAQESLSQWGPLLGPGRQGPACGDRVCNGGSILVQQWRLASMAARVSPSSVPGGTFPHSRPLRLSPCS